MRPLLAFVKRAASFFRSDRSNLDLRAELEGHLRMHIEDNLRAGMSPQEARRQALLKLGGLEQTKQLYRERRSLPMFETLLQDLKFAVRMLRKNPGFTAIAVLTLALGIGANTAIFSVINSVLLRNLPVKDPQQLVFLTNPNDHGGWQGYWDGNRAWLSYPEFQEFAKNNQVFSSLLAASSFTSSIPVEMEGAGATGEPVTSSVSLVCGSYFSVLGVNPILGRTFGTEVDRLANANPVAVISYRFWQEHFGGAPSAIGSRIRLRKTAYDIIGVTPPQFQGETVGEYPDIWVPLTQSELFPGNDYLAPETGPFHKTEWLQVIGRLRPGVTFAQARASLTVEFQQMLESQTGQMSASDVQKFMNQHLVVSEGSRGASVLRNPFGQPLLILMAVVGLILLIACANVANLFLARATARRRETAVRIALGGSLGRIVRQVLTESILLAAIGGGIGLLFAQWADDALLHLVSSGPDLVPLDVHPDRRILGFTLGISLLTGILFGLTPAFRSTRVDPITALKGSSSKLVGGLLQHGRAPIGKILVVGQVALSLLLLVVAGLFVRSLRNLAQADLGFDRDHLLQFRLDPVSFGYQQPELAQLYQNLLQRLDTIPGVRGATLSTHSLLSGNYSNDEFCVEGAAPSPGQTPEARWDMVGPGFFSTTGIAIIAGREIDAQDSGNGQRVGVINQTLARKYFANSNPIGQRIRLEATDLQPDFVIVGIVADSKHESVREAPLPHFYVPFFNPIGKAADATMMVRTTGDPSTVSSAIRSVVKQSAANLPPIEIQTISQRLAERLTTDRMITQLSGAFGGLAIILVCIGLYGVMSYAVAGRTNEIGIRMALGAQRSDALWMILRESLLLVSIGSAIGLPAVFGAGRWVSSLLFGVKPADPAAIALATAILFAVGILACYIPARRAMRVDPMVALRYE
jgi:predicted permease